MIRGSRLGCHRIFLTVPAVAVCSVAPGAARMQTHTKFASILAGKDTAAVRVAHERGLKPGLLSLSPIALVSLIPAKIDGGIGCTRYLIRADTGGVDLICAVNYLSRLFYRLTVRAEIERPEGSRGQEIAVCGSGIACHPTSQSKASEKQPCEQKTYP
jgi:hypothetical protein